MEALKLNHWAAREFPLCTFLRVLLLLLFFNFAIELLQFSLQSGYQSLIRYMICTYFLPFSGLPFYYVDSIFWYTNSENFHEVQCDLYIYIFRLFSIIGYYKILNIVSCSIQ